MLFNHDYRSFQPLIQCDDLGVPTLGRRLKFERAFQFLQLLRSRRAFDIEFLTYSLIRRSIHEQRHECQHDVFLGGSCNPTTWRRELAIPFFQSRDISFYNPQVCNWTPDLVEVEHRAKELATLLFFVIDHDTRSLAAIAEVGYLAARSRRIIVVMNAMPKNPTATKFIQQKRDANDKDDEVDYDNVCKARRTLRFFLQSLHLPVFDNVRAGLECAALILDACKRMTGDLHDEQEPRGKVNVFSSRQTDNEWIACLC